MAVVPERHVAVFAFPLASHPPILLDLSRKLASAIPTTVFSFFNSSKSNQALFRGLDCPNIRPYDISDGIPENFVSTGDRDEKINLFLEVAESEYRRGVQLAEEEIGVKVSCIVADAFLWFSNDLAQEMNVPWVAFRTGGVCSISAHFYTDLIREKSAQLKGSVRLEDEVVDFIPGFSKLRLGELPGGVLFGNIEKPIATMLHNMGKTLAKATVVSVNSFEELDPRLTKDLSSKFKTFLNIGPFHLISKQTPKSKTDEYSCISWLETQKPNSVAYVSFGTMAMPPPHELVALAEALEETKTPFLWSINNESQKHLPEGFLERTSANGTGKIVPWAPQVQILEHFATGVFVTHGGWKSVLESLGAGVPMICKPEFGDQKLNTWMVENVWEIGVRIENGVFTKHGTCRALEQVLSVGESSKRMKDKIEKLKDLAHKAVGPKGSSTQNFKTLVDVITGATL